MFADALFAWQFPHTHRSDAFSSKEKIFLIARFDPLGCPDDAGGGDVPSPAGARRSPDSHPVTALDADDDSEAISRPGLVSPLRYGAEASELAQPAGHFPMMVAVGKLGALLARRYQAKPAHEPRLRSNPAPSNGYRLHRDIPVSARRPHTHTKRCPRTSDAVRIKLHSFGTDDNHPM